MTASGMLSKGQATASGKFTKVLSSSRADSVGGGTRNFVNAHSGTASGGGTTSVSLSSLSKLVQEKRNKRSSSHQGIRDRS